MEGILSKKYRCDICGEKFNKKKDVIKHVRKEHPENALTLFYMFGTIGDDFADAALIDQQNSIIYLQDLTVDYNKISAEYKALIDKYNTAIIALNQYSGGLGIIRDVLKNTSDAGKFCS